MGTVARLGCCPSMLSRVLVVVVALFIVHVASADMLTPRTIANRTVVVTGATGRSGSKTYQLLKQQGATVRALVRNITNAREILGCTKCDASEGIFVGDITVRESLMPIMDGADALIITTGRSGKEKAKDILFDGVENQVAAFLSSPGPEPKDRHVSLISMMETTLLDTFWNKILAKVWGGWQVGFYSLNGEAFLMNAAVPFTIVKCCGLDETSGGGKKLLVGHDDKSWSFKDAHSVSRHDVAQVLAAAAMNPNMSGGLRFDFCSEAGTPPSSAMEVLKNAMYPWDPRKNATEA